LVEAPELAYNSPFTKKFERGGVGTISLIADFWPFCARSHETTTANQFPLVDLVKILFSFFTNIIHFCDDFGNNYRQQVVFSMCVGAFYQSPTFGLTQILVWSCWARNARPVGTPR